MPPEATSEKTREELLPLAYGSLRATLSWAILADHPEVQRLLDLLDEIDRLLDVASDRGLIPIRARADNYGDRYEWVISRLTHLSGTAEIFARIAEIESQRHRFLPGRH